MHVRLEFYAGGGMDRLSQPVTADRRDALLVRILRASVHAYRIVKALLTPSMAGSRVEATQLSMTRSPWRSSDKAASSAYREWAMFVDAELYGWIL